MQNSLLFHLNRHAITDLGNGMQFTTILDRLGYPVSDIEIGIGDDDVTIECVDVIVSRIARLCGVLNTRDKLAVSRKY